MTDKEIHSVLFRGVIAQLANLRGQEERPLSEGNDKMPHEYHLAWQRRPDRNFAHNYERDKFLQHRDKYVIVIANGHRFILVKLSDRQKATIYSKVVAILFGRDTGLAMEKLELLLGKMYDLVEIKERCEEQYVDFSNNRNHNHTRVTHEF